jgi:hypothetical protein
MEICILRFVKIRVIRTLNFIPRAGIVKIITLVTSPHILYLYIYYVRIVCIYIKVYKLFKS